MREKSLPIMAFVLVFTLIPQFLMFRRSGRTVTCLRALAERAFKSPEVPTDRIAIIPLAKATFARRFPHEFKNILPLTFFDLFVALSEAVL